MPSVTESDNYLILATGNKYNIDHTASTVDTSALKVRSYIYLPGDASATVIGSLALGELTGVTVTVEVDLVTTAAGIYIYQCIAGYDLTNPTPLIPNSLLASNPDVYLGIDGLTSVGFLVLPTFL